MIIDENELLNNICKKKFKIEKKKKIDLILKFNY